MTAVLPSLTTDKYTCQPVSATPPHTHTTAQLHFHTVYAIEEQRSWSMLYLRCRIASRGRIEIQLSAWSATCCPPPLHAMVWLCTFTATAHKSLHLLYVCIECTVVVQGRDLRYTGTWLQHRHPLAPAASFSGSCATILCQSTHSQC